MRRQVIGKLPELHAAQREIVDHPARFKVVAAGRRFGKGDLVIIDEFKRASHGQLCRFIAQSYASDGYQSAWRYAEQMAGQIPSVEVHLQKRWFHWPGTGGFVQFKTAEEPDSLRGEGIDYVAFDEAGTITHLEELWEQAVRPSLMDRKGGAIFIGTPQGFNYFSELAQKYRNDPDWAFFQYPTSANPIIDAAEIAAMRASLPELVARQEIDAEFVQLAGALFKRQNIGVLEVEPVGISWVRAWDLAWTEKTTSDFTAGAKMGMTANGTVVIADIVQGRMEWPDAVRTIAATARLDGRSVRCGVEVVGAQEGALQELLRDPLLIAHTILPIKVTRDKLTRALPLVARSEQNKFSIVRGNWNQKFLDELCLTGNTCVLCNRSAWKPISKIRAGEEVWTRNGLRKVIWSGQTGIKKVITRFGITGTPNHPVWTENRGWTPLQSLCHSDELVCVENPWFSTAERSIDTQTRHIDTSAAIFTRIPSGMSHRLRSIASFGNSLTAKFHAVMSSITEMVLTIIGYPHSSFAVAFYSTKNYTIDRRTRDPFINGIGCAINERDCVPVYNLSVEGEPEFFANGILVHNCAFPEGQFDDMVDACSGGMTLLSTPTGAITDPASVRVGSPTKFARPMFTPRRF